MSGFQVSGVSGTFGHLGIPENRTGWDQQSGPVSEFVGRISGSDIYSDLVLRTRVGVSVGGRNTNKKEHICTLSARTKQERDTPF